MRLRSRIGAVSLAAALSLTGTAVAWPDETPKGAERAEVTQQNTAVIHVEGMT
jgi:hypothetical protein